MHYHALLDTASTLPLKQLTRMHHLYRPISYCDWYKPQNEIYYKLRCPPCPVRICKPQINCERICKLCSFWEQLKDNCCGFYWPLPPMPMKSQPRVYVCKDLRKKKLTKKDAKLRVEKCIFNMHDCYDIPDCPEPNWDAVRHPT